VKRKDEIEKENLEKVICFSLTNKYFYITRNVRANPLVYPYPKTATPISLPL